MRGDGGSQIPRVNQSVTVDRQDGHLHTVQTLHGSASGQHRRVLGGLRDHVWIVGGTGQDGAADGQVVGLRPGAGEHDAFRVGADEAGDLSPGGV